MLLKQKSKEMLKNRSFTLAMVKLFGVKAKRLAHNVSSQTQQPVTSANDEEHPLCYS